MTRRILPYVALAVVVAALTLLSLRAVTVLRAPPDPIAEKFRSAERTIVYRVTAGDGPRFRLEGGRAPLKLVTYAVVDGAFDPARRIGYGLRLRIVADGRVVWQDDVHVESRQSKGARIAGGWRDEGTFSADGLELTDERILLVEPPSMPAGAILSMTLLGEAREVLVRAFRADTRDPLQREAVVEFLDEAERWELVRSSTYVPWELLPDGEKDRRLRRRWIRMSALGERDVDYRTRTIFVSDYRAPIVEVVADAGLTVARDAWVAVNVRGPAALRLEAPEARPGRALEVLAVGAAGGTWRLPLDRAGALPLVVGDGPTTLVISTDDDAPVRFRLSGAPDVALAPADARVPDAGELAPHRVRIPLVVAGPDAAVVAPARRVPGAPLLGRVLRIDARVVDAPVGALDAAEPALATLRVRFLDGGGRAVGEDQLVVGGAGSRFERLARGAALHTISDPFAARTIAPEGAATIEITADREVALRLYRWGGGTTLLDEPYRSAEVADHRWRYVDLAERTWFPLLPANHDELAAAGRVAELHAQARLEPTGAGGDGARARGDAGDLVTVVPVGHPEQQRAREPVAAEEVARVLAAWPAGAVTALAPGAARAIEFDVPRPDRARLSWEVPADAVGGELVVAIGDLPPLRRPLTATRGAIVLPRVPAGVHRVVVTAPAAAALFVDRPPAGDPRGLYRERRLYSLAAPLRVRLVKRGGERVRLHAIVYAPGLAGTTAPALRLTVGGGRPKRRAGVVLDKLTDADRAVALPAARRAAPARLVDLGGRAAGRPRTVSVTLLEDLAPGTHEVTIEALGGGERWVRFVATAQPASAPTDPRQWRVAPAWEDLGDE